MIDFRHTRFMLSAPRVEQAPADTGCEVAFAGRSNAGKSSALNAITGVRGLARTSKTPGRTQLINFFAVDGARRLVDLPGYGYARVPEAQRRSWHGMMDGYFGARQSLAGLVLVMDVRHPLREFDTQMLAWCRHRGLPVHALLTKADKLSRNQGQQTLFRVRRELPEGATAQLFSATRRTGVDEARSRIEALLPEAGADGSGSLSDER